MSGLVNGSLRSGAICIHDASYDEKYKLLKKLERIVTVEVPKAGLRICYISVTDLWADGSNGTASIISGGINSGGVVIQLKSQYSRGFAFRVQVYATKTVNMMRGKHVSGAILVPDKIYDVFFMFLQTVQRRVTVRVPKQGMRICFICVEDMWRDGTNGTVQLVDGGLDTGGVIIDLMSQVGRGFKFRVQVYASPILVKTNYTISNTRDTSNSSSLNVGLDGGCSTKGNYNASSNTSTNEKCMRNFDL